MARNAVRTDPGPRDEYADVLAWRLAVLRRCGFDEHDAAALAARRDVDLHAAIGLVQRGCPPSTAARILL